MLYIGIIISTSCALSISVPFLLLMHLVNDAQFSNITPSFLSSNHFAASLSLAPVTVIVA